LKKEMKDLNSSGPGWWVPSIISGHEEGSDCAISDLPSQAVSTRMGV